MDNALQWVWGLRPLVGLVLLDQAHTPYHLRGLKSVKGWSSFVRFMILATGVRELACLDSFMLDRLGAVNVDKTDSERQSHTRLHKEQLVLQPEGINFNGGRSLCYLPPTKCCWGPGWPLGGKMRKLWIGNWPMGNSHWECCKKSQEQTSQNLLMSVNEIFNHFRFTLKLPQKNNSYLDPSFAM